MTKIIKNTVVILGFFWLSMFTSSLFAEQSTEEWEHHVKAGITAWQQGYFLEAERELLTAVKKSFNTQNADYALIVTISTLADFRMTQDRYTEAIRDYENVINILKKYSEAQEGYAHILVKLGNAYMVNNQHDLAESKLLEALEIQERFLGESNTELHLVLGFLSYLYEQKKDIDNTIKYRERWLSIYSERPGANKSMIAGAYLGLCLNYGGLSDFEKAIINCENAVNVFESLHGMDSLEEARAKAVLAGTLISSMREEEAIVIYRKAIPILEKHLGETNEEVLAYLTSLAVAYQIAEKYKESLPIIERNISLATKAHGKKSSRVALLKSIYALSLKELKYYKRAEETYKEVLTTYQSMQGKESEDIANTLSNIAQLYADMDKHADALEYRLNTLAMRMRIFGSDNESVVVSLQELADSYEALKSFDMAEDQLRKAIIIREKISGTDSLDTAKTIDKLAWLLTKSSKVESALVAHQRSLSIKEKILGTEHYDLAYSIESIGYCNEQLGKYDLAEASYQRALYIREKTAGSNDVGISDSLYRLAWLYAELGRYTEAEPYIRRALEIRQEHFKDSKNPFVLDAMRSLAGVLTTQGRYEDAEKLFKQALTGAELYAEKEDVPRYLLGLSHLYLQQKRFQDAESYALKALNLLIEQLGHDNKRTLSVHGDLALLYLEWGQLDKAEEHALKRLQIQQGDNFENISNIAAAKGILGLIYLAKGYYKKAKPLYEEAIKTLEQALGSNHPDLAYGKTKLADIYYASGELSHAVKYSRDAVNSTVSHAAQVMNQSFKKSSGRSHGSGRETFATHIHVLYQLLTNLSQGNESLINESFETGQHAASMAAAEAIANMGARFASNTNELGMIAREYQDNLARWRMVDDSLLKIISYESEGYNKDVVDLLKNEKKILEAKLSDVSKKLEMNFPEYKELTNPRPVSITETKLLLSKEEAILSYLLDEKDSYLWVVNKNQARFIKLDAKASDILSLISKLRSTTDPTTVNNLNDLPVFDTQAAYELFTEIIAPAVNDLADIKHLYIVPDGALTSLPFQLLLTKPANNQILDHNYSDLAWLVKEYATTVLPSVSSLKALRLCGSNQKSEKPFAGFGDPVLNGDRSQKRGLLASKIFSRGPIANVNEIRVLPPLPETAEELENIAALLNADPDTIYLRERATESTIKNNDFSDVKVIAFATHGLMAGDFKGLAEPALVLTPPNNPTEQDDGLLTMSEIAQLRLNAEWVLLSACNSASPDGMPGAQGLSGLAKAFFYAGSRALLVSHWPVNSEATVILTTDIFRELHIDKSIGKAEAFRRAELRLLSDRSQPHLSHPMFWAPFVIVGDGSRPTM